MADAGMHRTIPALPVRRMGAAVAYYTERFGFDQLGGRLPAFSHEVCTARAGTLSSALDPLLASIQIVPNGICGIGDGRARRARSLRQSVGDRAALRVRHEVIPGTVFGEC